MYALPFRPQTVPADLFIVTARQFHIPLRFVGVRCCDCEVAVSVPASVVRKQQRVCCSTCALSKFACDPEYVRQLQLQHLLQHCIVRIQGVPSADGWRLFVGVFFILFNCAEAKPWREVFASMTQQPRMMEMHAETTGDWLIHVCCNFAQAPDVLRFILARWPESVSQLNRVCRLLCLRCTLRSSPLLCCAAQVYASARRRFSYCGSQLFSRKARRVRENSR